MHDDIRTNDLIWMRCDGIYYLARITKESEWHFNNSDDAHDHDACNQLTNIQWIPVGDESHVPGAITTAFIQGQAFQRILKPHVSELSKLIYNNKAKTIDDSFKYQTTLNWDEKTFFSLISPSDCEDLLYSFLFRNHSNFMVIPSTNKTSTQKYEFVIQDTTNGNHIYLQAKNGNDSLDADDFAHLLDVEGLRNEVYLLSVGGKVTITEKHQDRIHEVDAKTLFHFADSPDNKHFIPSHIRNLVEQINKR